MGNSILYESSASQDNGDYDAWEHICADPFDDDSETRYVAVVAAYFDAAYNHPQRRTANDPRIHTVAVYVAETDDWRRLRKEWRAELKAFMPNCEQPYFHVKDFEHARNVVMFGKGQISSKSLYQGWSLEKLNSLEARLHKVINRKRPDGSPRIAAFESNIVVSDYEETLPDDLREHPECRSHFIMNVVNAMRGVARWADINLYYDKPIHYIFAGGDNETGNLDRWFGRCFEREETTRHFRLGRGFTRIGYDLKWMKCEPALQMVDCPAYELNRAVVEWAKNDFNPILKRELRRSLSSLCRIDHVGATLRKPELIDLYETIRANDRQFGLRQTAKAASVERNAMIE